MGKLYGRTRELLRLPPWHLLVSSDQTVSLLNYQLPQVHSLYYYNIAFGVVGSTIRAPTFGFSPAPKYTPVQVGSTPIIDPVILFTAYFRPIDAESPYRAKDLIPGASFGLSLTSPSNNFYFGASSEIMRNVQATYGFTMARVPELPNSNVFNPTGSSGAPSSATPVTTQHFEKGGFLGLTFNFSGFIQSLFSSGAKASQ